MISCCRLTQEAIRIRGGLVLVANFFILASYKPPLLPQHICYGYFSTPQLTRLSNLSRRVNDKYICAFNSKPELLIISELVAKHATLQHQHIRVQNPQKIR